MTFLIHDDDEAEIKAWMKEVEAKRIAEHPNDPSVNYAGAIGGETTYIFTPTGVGIALEVSHFGVKKDFSHVENW